jgi:hypothetical protein
MIELARVVLLPHLFLTDIGHLRYNHAVIFGVCWFPTGAQIPEVIDVFDQQQHIFERYSRIV